MQDLEFAAEGRQAARARAEGLPDTFDNTDTAASFSSAGNAAADLYNLANLP
jgi:hypothetical protein